MSEEPGPLRVLLVEDAPGDAALVRAALAEAAPACEVSWVETLAGADVALTTARWSCVLLDLGLPDADGPDALARTLAAAAGTPVVVLTGNDDEAAGRIAVAGGAQDYLVKGGVTPLLLVRAIDYAVERHRLGRELQVLLDSAGDGVFATDVDGICTFVNRAACTMLGYDASALLGRPIHDLVHRCEEAEGDCLLRVALVGGSPLGIVAEWLTPADREPFAAELSCAPISDAGVVKGAVVSFCDVTARLRAEEGMRQLAAIVEHSNDAIFSQALDGIVLSWNEAATRIFGFDAEDIVGNPVSAMTPADRLHEDHFILAQARQGSSVEHFETVRVRSDGRVIDVSLTASPTRDAEGTVVSMAVIARDITERKRSISSLAAQSKVLGMVAEGKPLGDILDAVSRIVEGDSLETTCVVSLRDPDTGEVQHSGPTRFGSDDAGEHGSWSVPVRGERDTRELGVLTVHQAQRAVPTPGEMARAELAARLVAIAVERTQAEGRLVHQALHDALTQLPNRVLLMDRLAGAVARAARGGSSIGVLYLDLDRFKVVNDSLGHAAGDALLQEVAARLKRLVRPGDTIARLGGDEFAVLCEELEDVQVVTEVAERIERALRTPFCINGGEVHVSTSIGIAIASDASTTPESLLRDADAAMYQAKDRGRSRYEVFDHALRSQATYRLEIENALRHAIENDELRVHFQPEVDLVTGAVTGAEALVRWQHPKQGTLLPGAFIPVAEETGLIVPLGQWVLEEACRQRRLWVESHPEWPPLGMSVNISARQLARPEFPEMVADVLVRNGMPAAALCLEITETVLMEDVETVSVAFDALRRLGVRVAVDDFGTGYSSLVYLKRFPVRRLKVDRRFVSGLGHDADDAAIVTGVVSLAHALGLECVAEGVERPEQLAALRAAHCDLAQGFHWSQPLSASQFEVWMTDHSMSWHACDTEAALQHLSADQREARALVGSAGADASVLRAAAEARSAFAMAREPADAVKALVRFVNRLGGTVIPASERDPRAIPVDLSFGEGEPILPVCDSFSTARMHLIRLLPGMADEARAVIDTLRHNATVPST